MIRNIVLDIGNVLVDYRLKEFLAEKGFDGQMIRRILRASIMGPYWEQFERSELTEAEALKAFASIDPEIEKELERAYGNVKGMLTIRDFAIDWVKEMKAAGYGVYYLSNYSEKAYHECADSLAFMEFMDGGLLSWRARRTKPDPEFYNMFLKEYGLNAEECIFIDDTGENVVAAEKIGFKGIVFTGLADAKAKIVEITGAHS